MNPSWSRSELDLLVGYCLMVTPTVGCIGEITALTKMDYSEKSLLYGRIAWLSRPYLVLGDRYAWKEEAGAGGVEGR